MDKRNCVRVIPMRLASLVNRCNDRKTQKDFSTLKCQWHGTAADM